MTAPQGTVPNTFVFLLFRMGAAQAFLGSFLRYNEFLPRVFHRPWTAKNGWV